MQCHSSWTYRQYILFINGEWELPLLNKSDVELWYAAKQLSEMQVDAIPNQTEDKSGIKLDSFTAADDMALVAQYICFIPLPIYQIWYDLDIQITNREDLTFPIYLSCATHASSL